MASGRDTFAPKEGGQIVVVVAFGGGGYDTSDGGPDDARATD